MRNGRDGGRTEAILSMTKVVNERTAKLKQSRAQENPRRFVVLLGRAGDCCFTKGRREAAPPSLSFSLPITRNRSFLRKSVAIELSRPLKAWLRRGVALDR